MTFFKRHPLAGLALGVALVACGLLTLPLASETADAASAPTSANCRLTKVQLDDGYGLTRTGYKADCP
jgi:hypothetical protein